MKQIIFIASSRLVYKGEYNVNVTLWNGWKAITKTIIAHVNRPISGLTVTITPANTTNQPVQVVSSYCDYLYWEYLYWGCRRVGSYVY